MRTFRIIERNLGWKSAFRIEERRWFRWHQLEIPHGDDPPIMWFPTYDAAKTYIQSLAIPCDFVVGTITIL